MSSMFKKKAGLAFKPKVKARPPRPSPAAPSVQDSLTQPTTEAVVAEEGQQAEADAPVDSTVSDKLDAPISSDRTSQTATPPDRIEPGRSEPEESNPSAAVEPSTTDPPQEAATVQAGEAGAVGLARGETTEPHSVPIPAETPSQTTSSTEPTPAPQPTTSVTSDASPPSRDDATQPDDQPVRTSISSANPEPDASDSPVEPAPAASTQRTPIATRKPRTRRQAATTDAADSSEGPASKRRRRETTEGDEGTVQRKPRKRNAPAPNGEEGQARKRRTREVTPEDAETQVVDLQKLKMSDLTKDLHIGKKFSRHDELRERERKAKMKSKADKDAEQSKDTPGGSGPDRSRAGRTPTTSTAPTPAPASGPQFRIVDGQIVVDQSSLVMDRHARAAAAQAGEDMETIEENDFTRLITSNSFMNTSKLKGPNIWTEEETELFYRGLSMFGTDFEIISKMFPGKQRRHVKLKYNREERHCPARVTAAVVGVKTVRMDIDEYKAVTGAEFESVESIEAEQRKVEESYEAERKRIADEQAEIMRKKREELFADDGEGAGARKKGKRKGKQAVQYGLNGEPITTES